MSHGKPMKLIRREEKSSDKINILTHYDDHTLLDKSGKLIQIIKIKGLNFSTQDDLTLDLYKIRRNHLFKSFASQFALYCWEVKRRVNDFAGGNFDENYSSSVNDQYKEFLIKQKLFHKELYLAIVSKHPEGIFNKGWSFLQQLTKKFDKPAKQNYLLKRHQELNEIVNRALSTFSAYHCELLGTYIENEIVYSEPLEVISYFLNGEYSKVPLNIEDASKVLPRKRLFFNPRSGVVEMRSPDQSSRFLAFISIKGYSATTYQSMLNRLNELRFPYVITQSFRFYDKENSKKVLRDQQNEMLQSKDESISLTHEIDSAFDDAASGEVGFGKHHFSMACFADSIAELNQYVSEVSAKFSDAGIIAVREDVAAELSFWAQLPGNFAYIARPADISTLNIASFINFHNYPLGKLHNNHWGDAVTVLETISGSPYYFNFHYKDIGNFLVFGSTGSGKTVLVGFLILQSMKFGGKRIIFDKDRGLEIVVKAMGGVYERIRPTNRTGFNPCHLKDSIANRKFLTQLFSKMFSVNGDILNEQDRKVIERAIAGIYELPFADRRICHLAPFFGTKEAGSLRARFDEWHSDGPFAWAFDHDEDSLNLNPDVIGFDLTYLLKDPICKTPILMYLIHRIEETLFGERGIIFFDEGFKVLDDDFFKPFFNDWPRTYRKKNIIFGLATQVVNDITQYGSHKAINEGAYCKIFFPNPAADEDVYINKLGLTYKEYELIKTIPDDQHYFLLTHGQGTHKESVVARINLSQLEDVIAVISAREESLILLDQIQSEVWREPELWLPIFHTNRKKLI